MLPSAQEDREQGRTDDSPIQPVSYAPVDLSLPQSAGGQPVVDPTARRPELGWRAAESFPNMSTERLRCGLVRYFELASIAAALKMAFYLPVDDVLTGE